VPATEDCPIAVTGVEKKTLPTGTFAQLKRGHLCSYGEDPEEGYGVKVIQKAVENAIEVEIARIDRQPNMDEISEGGASIAMVRGGGAQVFRRVKTGAKSRLRNGERNHMPRDRKV